MKICIISDLHLPYIKSAVQYKAFESYLHKAVSLKADMIICPGDFTANGDEKAAEHFISRLKETGIPFAVTAGNSDLRSPETKNKIISLISPCLSGDKNIFTLNDYDRTVSDDEFRAVENARPGAVVTMHHPYSVLLSPSRERFIKWRKAHPDVYVMSAHLHRFEATGRDISLPCADPDKNIGENPCVLFFDTESGEIQKDYFYCPMPETFTKLIGISCYDPLNDIPFARRHALKHIELRPGAVKTEREALKKELCLWKGEGGETLSLHAPDIIPVNNSIKNEADWKEFTAFAHDVKANRITLHVPRCTVADYPGFKAVMSAFLAERLKELPDGCIIGIENMHMTAADTPDESRRFGYIPQEVKEFTEAVKEITDKNVGINLDIGHARNNAPFSEKYTLGAWYAETGKLTVGYHIHQVTSENGKFENHTPFTSSYGKLISLASFYRGLTDKTLNAVPIILEVRGGRYTESISWLGL